MSNLPNNKEKKRYKFYILLAVEAAAIIVVVILYLLFTNYLKNKEGDPNPSDGTKQEQTNEGDNSDPNNNNDNDNNGNDDNNNEEISIKEEITPTPDLQKELEDKLDHLLEEADTIAKGYDYDKAIELVESFEDDYKNYDRLTKAVEDYKVKKDNLVPLGAYESVNEISHIFFHSLIADTALAFDGDYDANGYNYYMTTVSEFQEMMEQMYEDGYVLVSIHDVAKKVTNADGTISYVAGDIMLPPNKKPFVLSQDDVNYYDYMTGDGFATRMILDENGDPKNEMILSDGSVSVGDYDMVPVLDTFIKEHPDFSYKGARGLIALTGYEGSLGYRTNDQASPTYEKDKEAVKAVAEGMKAKGWEFASHSYGHRDMGKATYNFTKKDSNRWMEEVGSLIGPTDVYIFPYGIDIETTMGRYESDKFTYLKELGFDYYCGVYKGPWIQIQDDYVRMTRRPLDGQAMLQFPERLRDLFDLNTVIDSARPELE
ncbi:MAG: polysaccharide deacetylase family protein [Anaerocolumna sp.]